ncbi:hypothetical protein FQN53_009224 [Emmonsiellopsis sp. PD_33]|nr:hypothetical protein FQN53_009224 [Emmonsiellopsis sp. PD_33]KAK2801355.1 hypothetical protein FQN51_005455 [Onygenales sp. PD_10]
MEDGELRKQLGQLFIVGFDGLSATLEVKRLIGAPYYIGAVILTKRNIANAEQAISLVNDLQSAAKEAGHARPLFVCIEEDVSLTSAIASVAVPQRPGLETANALCTAEDAYQYATASAKLWGALGINMGIADACNAGFGLQKRSTAMPPLSGDQLGRLSAAQLAGLRDNGIIPCVKGFPGRADSDRGLDGSLSTILKDRDALECDGFIPYRRAIAEEVESLMTTHAVLPCLDDSLPISLSDTAVNVLRSTFQHGGLIISDYLDVSPIKSHYATERNAILSFHAGSDVVMVSDTSSSPSMFDAVLNACKNGEIPLQQISNSVLRVDKLKDRFLNRESASKSHGPGDLDSIVSEYQRLSTITTNEVPLKRDSPSCGVATVDKPQQFAIEPFNSAEAMSQVIELWHNLLPQYAVPASRLADLLMRPNGAHFTVHSERTLIGFVATYVNKDRPAAFISALLVHPAHQSRGIGTALIHHARTHLRSVSGARAVTIGSSFPRFWPGVPLDIKKESQAFFTHRGFCVHPGPSARDYFVDLKTYEAPAMILERAAKAGIKFMPWEKDQYGECMARQKELFGTDDVWIGAFERLAQAEQHSQVMVAIDSSGKQVGWTLMLGPGVGLSNDLAFPPLLGDNTGQIGCVGVHHDVRRKGVGLALIATAALDLQKRGVEFIFIDWVNLVNWYEQAGFKVWREYRTMTLNELA